MRWVTFRTSEQEIDRVGLQLGDTVHGLEPGTRLVDLLGDGHERLVAAAEQAQRSPAGTYSTNEIRLRPPIPHPPSIRDYSAFEEHVRAGLAAQGFELGKDWYEVPVFWFCNPNSAVGERDPVVIPGHTHEMDYELEIAAVVGREGIDLDPAEAEDHIAGYCIMNDWSARDLQRDEMHRAPIGPAKGKDFATSFGPALVTPDELAERYDGRTFELTMTATVNGQEYSRGNLRDIYWSFGQLVAYASRHARLYPGDLIGTGTCGTGCLLELSASHGSEKYPWLEDGDEVTLEVEGLGSLTNRIVRGSDPKPLR